MGAKLQGHLARHIQRFANKKPDWDAFPSNRDVPGLERAQYRFVGAGGSPKVDDPDKLPAEHFTVSMIHQAPGKISSLHEHEVEEAFFVIQGVLTVTWECDGELTYARLGPKDMILNPPHVGHDYRNDGVEPALLSIMLGSGKPAPVMNKRPSRPISETVGAASAEGRSPRQREMARHIVRYLDQPPTWQDAAFARRVYIGDGGAPAGHFRKELIHLPVGQAIQPYVRPVEDVYLVLGGYVTVGWQKDAGPAEQRLGPRDVVFNPAGQRHYARNDGVEDAQVLVVIGSPDPRA